MNCGCMMNNLVIGSKREQFGADQRMAGPGSR
jgi:hypothetical protein